ncbi:Rieske 2Fe-2S domain-containing protein [Pseudonocardia sp. NPDC049635]|uniref:Rieske 2Fe-2S domain-containing protein n=1 Tax=Pseudonocardia sp. NPDC049635 TaxID=3155506 RepID=UPI0033E567FB
MNAAVTGQWHAAIELDDLWEGEMEGVEVGGTGVLLVNVDGEVHAYRNRCPHQAWPLDEGDLDDDGVLTCTRHLWEFDARTGAGINPDNCALSRYPTRVEDGTVYVEIG